MNPRIMEEASLFVRVVSQVLWSYVEPRTLAAYAVTCREAAASMTRSSRWETLYRRRWALQDKVPQQYSAAEWRAAALMRGAMEEESQREQPLEQAVAAALAHANGDEDRFFAFYNARRELRRGFQSFDNSFPMGTAPASLHTVALSFHDGGSGGISGACNVALQTVVAVYLPCSIFPLYVRHEYHASGYNDDPTVEGTTSVCVSSLKARKPLPSRWKGFVSAWTARHRASKQPAYLFRPAPNDAAATAAAAHFSSKFVPVLRIRSLQKDEGFGGILKDESHIARAFPVFLDLLGPLVEVYLKNPSARRRWELQESRTRTECSLPECILRYCEAPRALNQGISDFTSTALSDAMHSAANSPLLTAIENGDYTEATKLISSENVNFCSRVSKDTPLLALSKRRDAPPSLVRALVEAGASLEATNPEGHTAFEVAARLLNTTAAAELAACGAKVPPDTELLEQVLSSWGLKDEHLPLLELLVRDQPIKEGVSSTLTNAADAAMVQWLVQHGAQVNHPEDPLSVALKNERFDAARELLALGATPTAKSLCALVAQPKWGRRGHAADATAERVSMFKTLLASGAPPQGDGVYWPLHSAAERSESSQFVELLLEAGVDPDLPNSSGLTALRLMLGIEGARPQLRNISAAVLQILVRAGAQYTLNDACYVATAIPLAARDMLERAGTADVPAGTFGAALWLALHGHISVMGDGADFTRHVKWTDADMEMLAQVLRVPTCNVTSINLQYENLGDAGATALAAAMPHSNLRSLNLTGCRGLTAVGCRAIIAAIPDTPSLHECTLVFCSGRHTEDEVWKAAVKRELDEVVRPRKVAKDADAEQEPEEQEPEEEEEEE